MQPWKSRIARHHRNVNYIHKFRYSCAPPLWMLIDVVGKFITRAWGLRGRKSKPFYRMHLKENVNSFLNIHNFNIICDDRPVDSFKTEPFSTHRLVLPYQRGLFASCFQGWVVAMSGGHRAARWTSATSHYSDVIWVSNHRQPDCSYDRLFKLTVAANKTSHCPLWEESRSRKISSAILNNVGWSTSRQSTSLMTTWTGEKMHPPNFVHRQCVCWWLSTEHSHI